MKAAQNHAHRTDLRRRGVARSADEVFTPTPPQGEQTTRTAIKSSRRRRGRPCKERRSVWTRGIRQHQRLLSLEREQFVHTGHFSLCVIYHFSSISFFCCLEYCTHRRSVCASAFYFFAAAEQPRSVSSHGLRSLGSHGAVSAPRSACACRCGRVQWLPSSPPKLAAAIRRGGRAGARGAYRSEPQPRPPKSRLIPRNGENVRKITRRGTRGLADGAARLSSLIAGWQSFRPFDGNNTTSHSIRSSNSFVLKHSQRFGATGKKNPATAVISPKSVRFTAALESHIVSRKSATLSCSFLVNPHPPPPNQQLFLEL